MWVTILTDASHNHKSGVCGYGYWIVSDRGSNGGGGHFKMRMSNINQAEMSAIVNAIWIGLERKLIHDSDAVLIQTDSTTAISRLENSPNTFTNKAPYLDTVFYSYRELIDKHDLKIKFKHVKAHTQKQDKRSKANAMCDQRAYEHMRKAHKHYEKFGVVP